MELDEKKKKKPYNSKSITTGDIDYNIRQFNKRMGTDFPGNDNNNPSTEEAKANKAAEAACKAANTVVAASPDGGVSVSTCGGESSGSGDAGASSAGMGESLSLQENVASSMPVKPLSDTEIKNAISKLTDTETFSLGYIKEFSNQDGIPSKFNGGRGSQGQPFVRIFKCTEYSALTLKPQVVRDDILGTARHTGDKGGFMHNTAIPAFGGYTPDATDLLQVYLAEDSVQHTKYFISLNDEDLYEIDKKDLLPYLTPMAGTKLLAPFVRKASGIDKDGNPVYESRPNRLKITGIYMINNLGTSICK